jgi:hypothetical protein
VSECAAVKTGSKRLFKSGRKGIGLSEAISNATTGTPCPSFRMRIDSNRDTKVGTGSAKEENVNALKDGVCVRTRPGERERYSSRDRL